MHHTLSSMLCDRSLLQYPTLSAVSNPPPSPQHLRLVHTLLKCYLLNHISNLRFSLLLLLLLSLHSCTSLFCLRNILIVYSCVMWRLQMGEGKLFLAVYI
ncbi:hypothetical protein PMIN01_00441 [Paraphaeosphaeria minitans]|uniref:Uncharacterized protein n=1 Tax=Paraphaeosphaeria minitans TaxID=565426 RepID=A0A9P6KVY1_9PLEO|nr:hypothetical protein PMIN01_00441 [Paraphaeosphaeria minitans]